MVARISLPHRYFTTALPDWMAPGLEARAVIANYFVQSALALVLCSVLKSHFVDAGGDANRKGLLLKVVTISMLSPNLFAVLGLPVDLNTVEDLSRHFREQVLREATTVYES